MGGLPSLHLLLSVRQVTCPPPQKISSLSHHLRLTLLTSLFFFCLHCLHCLWTHKKLLNQSGDLFLFAILFPTALGLVGSGSFVCCCSSCFLCLQHISYHLYTFTHDSQPYSFNLQPPLPACVSLCTLCRHVTFTYLPSFCAFTTPAHCLPHHLPHTHTPAHTHAHTHTFPSHTFYFHCCHSLLPSSPSLASPIPS